MSTRTSREIEVSIAEPFSQELSFVLPWKDQDRPEDWLRMVVDCALQVALPPRFHRGQVSLLVADDTTVQELNREFRGLDEVTDVLSFSPSHPGHWEGEADAPNERYLKPGPPEVDDELPFVLPPDELPLLGDIVISYPQTRRQALARLCPELRPQVESLDKVGPAEGNEPVARELALLIIHGVLHLVGYDHLEPGDTALMQAKEKAALSLAFGRQPQQVGSISNTELPTRGGGGAEG